ncbi:MAG: DUF1501 domain-containing protein [Planctomycetota bacterium]
MLHVGSFRASGGRGIGRRSFLQLGASVPAGLMLGSPAVAAVNAPPRAKSVIFVWLWGAPSHIDTFDPKPDAPGQYRGPFSPISTKQPGVYFTELLPRLAARNDRFSLIRSHVTSAPGHPDAGTIGLTGFQERPQPVHPNFGSIVSKHRGSGGDLPPFVMVGRGIPRDVVRIVDGYGGGRLGKGFDPFMVSCSDRGEVELPSLQLLDGLSPNRITDRNIVRSRLDASLRRWDQAGARNWDRSYQRAFDLITSPASRQAFDLTQEAEDVRSAYGHTTFGQSCLMARRLAESGVPYIQVNWSEYVECMTPNCDFGWDTHIYNFELLQDTHGPIFDRAFSALLDDLESRGLLETTLVVAMGEFGRTPKISNRAARDHWPRCYFSLWAGGGVQAGRTIGESDRFAEDPVTTAITPLMVGTTICELAGLDTQARAEMRVLDSGSVIQELL